VRRQVSGDSCPPNGGLCRASGLIRAIDPTRRRVSREGHLTVASAPLVAIRVVTVALNVPGPVAAARLLGLGASVTKVEPPDGDPLSRYAPDWYEELRSGQEVLRLDLKEESARTVFDERLLKADVLLTSQRPNALARLGISTAALRDRYPRLLHVAIVGMADRPDQPGHDLTYLAPTGLLVPSRLPRTLLVDLAGAERVVSAVLCLVLQRELGHAAGHTQVALAQVAQDFAAPYRIGLTSPGGILGGGLSTYAMYHAREGWVALAALEERLQVNMRNALGLSDLSEKALSQSFRERTAKEWDAWAQDRDLPLAALPAEGSD
jgi:alpha-methylacyl-CoA racemase